ncbi:MAG TPA: HEAT repeat domain-containing protein [Polyangiaceae bacterium]|nr:HEAT repeat domain-containing protein [Polyangiaceae bacterium]
MQRLLRSALLIAVVSTALSAPAKPRLDDLTTRLANSDFRVRVQAALELGRTGDARALSPLVSALDDPSAAVRAAAAAALGKLGDSRGKGALAQHRDDSSNAVRAEIKSALDKLEPKRTSDDEATQVVAQPRKIVVKLAGVHNGTRVKSTNVERDVLAESKRKLGELGVSVVAEEGDASESSAMVKLIPSIQKLQASRDGDSVVYSAKVEYILQTLPDETIMARLSGSASAAASDAETQDRVAIARLRREVLSAAIQSALSRASNAFQAAARL